MDHDMRQDPADFVRWLAALPRKRDLCVECGAGRAELSAALQPSFNQVTATDASPPCQTRQYYPVRKFPAEALPFSASSVDLLFSMQSAHHFDLGMHIEEAKRVLRHGGIFGVFSWGELLLDRQVTSAYAPIFEAISPFWEPAREWVVSGYEGLDFPGTRIDVPRFHLTKWLTPERLETELASWSAVQAALTSGVEFPEPRLVASGVKEDTRFACQWRIVGQVFRY